MIGYVIVPREEQWIRKGVSIISKLKTFKFFKRLESDHAAALLFKNEHKNSYFHEDRGFTLCVTGTFIFKDLGGLEALRCISESLSQEENYSAIYQFISGPFNLIIHNKKKKKLDVLTSREGLQSGFQAIKEGKSFFSSSLILIAALMNSAIDLESVRDFVSIGATVNGRTIFDGVYQMDSASIYKEDGSSWQNEKLWKIEVEEKPFDYSNNEIVDQFEKRMEANLAFLKNYRTNEICTDLSGGTDSRTVLAALLKTKGNVHINVAGPADHEDVVIHRKVADKLNLHSLWYPDPLQKFEVTSDKIDEAVEIADGTRNPITLMPALPFFKLRSEKYRMLMGGNGGPLFKDHYWLFEFNRVGKKQEPNWRRIAHLSTVDYPWQDNVFKDNEREGDRLAEIYHNHSKQIKGTNNQKLDFVYFDLKIKAYHAPQFTTCNQFFDIYHPLCDGNLVEFSMNIKPDIRKRANLQFSLIYKNNKDLAWIPTNNYCPAVPSMGKFFYLRWYVVMRYALALWRKVGMYVLGRNILPSVYKMSGIYEQLNSLGYVEKYLDFERMHTAAIFNREEFTRMIQEPYASSNLDYLLNAMAVELAIEKKERLQNINSLRD